jgi:phosphatidylglycerophosphatase A
VAPLAFLPLSLPLRLLLLVMIFALGVLVCTRAETVLHAKDPGCVIWDELFGQWIALLPLGTHAPWWLLVAGFLLFRVFDIFKPWPVRQLEQKYDGGLGIMLDDGAAGIYALLGVWLLQRLA